MAGQVGGGRARNAATAIWTAGLTEELPYLTFPIKQALRATNLVFNKECVALRYIGGVSVLEIPLAPPCK